MKVSELVGYARSQANIASSGAISHDDEDKTVNISWKDIYARILEKDDDYFTKEVLFQTISTYATTNPNEYKIPLPEDFYRLRFVDFQGGTAGGNWSQMHKFPLSMRNNQPSEPHYRFDATNLWIVGANVTQVRVHYYPPPAVMTHPYPTQSFGAALAPSVQATVTLPFYIDSTKGMLYVIGNHIWYESLMLDSTTDLITSVTPIRPTYYKGYLYFITAGNISRGVFNPLVPATVIGVAITVVGGITSFTIFDNTIYFTTAAGIFTCNLDGTTIVNISAIVADDVSLLGNGPTATLVARVVATNTVVSVTSPAIALNVLHMTTDRTYIYTLDTSLVVHKLTVAVVGTSVTVTNDYVLHADAQYLGNTDGGYISLINEETTGILAQSTLVDTDITYPANIIIEIMAIQGAIDFCTKLGKDIGTLKLRLGDPSIVPTTGIWGSFFKMFKRDDYEAERIKNSRLQQSGLGML
jgi:hypothetical protein